MKTIVVAWEGNALQRKAGSHRPGNEVVRDTARQLLGLVRPGGSWRLSTATAPRWGAS